MSYKKIVYRKEFSQLFNHSKDLALFLEQLRVSRGISQEDFTDGIISNRQYQRYVNGSSAMPFHLLDDFAERLNVKKDFLLLEFDSYGIKETNNIIDFLNAVNNDDIDGAKKISKDIDPKFILDSSNLKFYQYAKLFQEYKEKKISRDNHFNRLMKFIEYPNILNKNAMTMVETMVLSNLLDYVNDNDQYKILNKIKNFIDNPSLVWTGSQIITYNMLMFRMAKYSGIKKDFENVILFCNKAINLNHKSKYFLNLDYYYYFLALAYHQDKKKMLFEENLYKCFTVLELIDSPVKTTNYITMAHKDFGIDLMEFAQNYINKKYKKEV